MASVFSRAVLAPLKLSPDSFSKIQVLLSPSLGKSSSQVNGAPNGTAGDSDSPGDNTPQVPFLPSSCLPQVVQECASLTGPNARYTSSPHLPSGHIQTIYSAGVDTVEQDAVFYKRKVILVPDGGIISLDIAERDEDEGKERETIVILHGLTGGSQESYVRHCVKRLLDGPGYRTVVVNFRGCANTPVTSPQLYSAAKTSDLRCALLFLAKLYPTSPFIGLSFSLGANVLSKYLGEEGDKSPLLAGIACAAPFHLKRGSELLEGSAVRRTIYSRAMNNNLIRVSRRHAATLDLDERLREALDDLLDSSRAQARAKLRKDDVANSKDTLKYVDDTIVRLIGGHRQPYGDFPYDSADHYYTNNGALLKLRGLKRPLLALNADDDPIVASDGVAGIRHLMGYHDKDEKEDFGHTQFIVLATTQGGGHLGWWEGYRKPVRWVHLPVIDFSKAIFKESKRLITSRKEADPEKVIRSTYEKLPTTSKEVMVELMPAEMLPSYVEVRDRKGKLEKKDKPEKTDKRFDNGPRLPWLRTHLLPDAILVHPSMSRHGWCGHEPAASTDFSMNAQGQIVNDGQSRSNGWCAFSAHMTCDTEQPEVGFLELPPWTRVAGAGEHFQGGKDTPGLYGQKGPASDGTVAGL